MRRIGAITLVAVLGLAACSQLPVGRPVDASPIELLPTTSSTTTTAEPEEVAPFVYRVGVLEGLTTANFWAFQGEETTVWNAYILGPTKPSLYSVHPTSFAIQPELASGYADPVEVEGKWTVTVDLHPGLTWSDGTPITSSDLVYTFETVRRLELDGAWAGSYPETVTAITSGAVDRVVIEFSERPTLEVWPHAVGLAPIMASHVWEDATAGVATAS